MKHAPSEGYREVETRLLCGKGSGQWQGRGGWLDTQSSKLLFTSRAPWDLAPLAPRWP